MKANERGNDKHETDSMNSSYFSTRHFDEQQREMRTSGFTHTAINLFKGYVGISFLSIPHAFAELGIGGATMGLCFVLCLNLYSVWLLLKTRNKYRD